MPMFTFAVVVVAVAGECIQPTPRNTYCVDATGKIKYNEVAMSGTVQKLVQTGELGVFSQGKTTPTWWQLDTATKKWSYVPDQTMIPKLLVNLNPGPGAAAPITTLDAYKAAPGKGVAKILGTPK